ncbi:hypothetical protein J4402_00535 [Candidatus Pacearchaeota archaeon]|nr:hypothetical protein [Candidatus Pacearchaeota archaeon]
MNKKAVSEIISYSILIVIAVGISILVYSALKLYLPSERQTCPEEVSMIIQSATCKNSYLILELKNQGLFNISALYIRMADSARTTRTQINKGDEILLPQIPPGGTKRWEGGVRTVKNEEEDVSIVTKDADYTVEIQPALISKQKIILCERAVITETINCKVGDGSAP